MRMRIHAVHADDAHMQICTSQCTCKNLDAHQPHTKEKMSHFEETLNKIEDSRWLLALLRLLFIHPSHINHSGASNWQSHTIFEYKKQTLSE